jgi:hypothetical protein
VSAQIVYELGVNVLVGTENAQTRTLGSAGDLLTDSPFDAFATLKLCNGHGFFRLPEDFRPSGVHAEMLD